MSPLEQSSPGSTKAARHRPRPRRARPPTLPERARPPRFAAISTAPVAAAQDDQVTTLSPAVRRAVLEYHVDPTSIRGTGKDGRLTKDDVIAAAQAQKSGSPAKAGAQPEAKASPPASETKAAPPGPPPSASTGERKEERVRLSRMRQTIASRLKESQNTSAILTTFNDVDMTAVIEARSRYKDFFEKKHGIRLGFMGFFVKACALAAKDVPSVNGVIEGEEIVYRDYFDVSIAVPRPRAWSSRSSATPRR